MNLIPINVSKNDEQYVSGRLLHMFLEIKTPYTQWFERMCDYGFTENLDYIGLSQKCEKPLGGRPQQDHSKIQTKWTQKGRLRIHEILTARGITAVCKDIA